MTKACSRTTHSPAKPILPGLSKFATAAVIYAGFAIYLYQPHFRDFKKLQYLLVANAILASLGCFLLSRRWVAGFSGSFFAGAIYGFGPFLLGLGRFHVTAGFLAACIPWLFLPASLVPKARRGWLSVPFSVLPFLAVFLFFQLAAQFHLFAIPIQLKLHLADLTGLLAPLVATRQNTTLAGLYHVPIGSLVIGISMLLAARRMGVIALFAIGMVLSLCDAFFNISPIIWLTIPVLLGSVLAGEGMQGLVSAGFADRKWVLAAAVIMAALSIVAILLEIKCQNAIIPQLDYAGLFAATAKMYVFGATAVAIVFFMTCAKLRIRWLRVILLSASMAVDIFFSARFIVDNIL